MKGIVKTALYTSGMCAKIAFNYFLPRLLKFKHPVWLDYFSYFPPHLRIDIQDTYSSHRIRQV